MRERILNLITSHGKVHNLVLLITALSFAGCAWRCQDAGIIGAVGATLAALYGANAYAGTKASTPPPAA